VWQPRKQELQGLFLIVLGPLDTQALEGMGWVGSIHSLSYLNWIVGAVDMGDFQVFEVR
jgi:hypothetical protein